MKRIISAAYLIIFTNYTFVKLYCIDGSLKKTIVPMSQIISEMRSKSAISGFKKLHWVPKPLIFLLKLNTSSSHSPASFVGFAVYFV